MNLEIAFIIQGPNRRIRRSIKSGPARGSAQGAQPHMWFQKDHELASSCLLFVMRSLTCQATSLTTPDVSIKATFLV
jgi:hypothetical protein